MFSSFGYIIAYLMISGYYLAKETGYDELAKQLNWVPLVALIMFFFVHAVGYGWVYCQTLNSTFNILKVQEDLQLTSFLPTDRCAGSLCRRWRSAIEIRSPACAWP